MNHLNDDDNDNDNDILLLLRNALEEERPLSRIQALAKQQMELTQEPWLDPVAVKIAIDHDHPLETIQYLLDRTHPNILYQRDEQGENLFHYACSMGADRLDVVKFLCDRHLSNIHNDAIRNTTTERMTTNILRQINNDQGLLPFHLACLNGTFHVVNYLLQIDPGVVQEKGGWHDHYDHDDNHHSNHNNDLLPLHLLVRNGREESPPLWLLQKMIDLYPPALIQKTTYHTTPGMTALQLYMCTECNSVEGLQVLIDANPFTMYIGCNDYDSNDDTDNNNHVHEKFKSVLESKKKEHWSTLCDSAMALAELHCCSASSIPLEFIQDIWSFIVPDYANIQFKLEPNPQQRVLEVALYKQQKQHGPTQKKERYIAGTIPFRN